MKILFITSASLKDLKRGTPIRIFNFIEQLKKENDVSVYESVPLNRKFEQLKKFRGIIKITKPDIVMTATDVDISLPFWLKILTGVKIGIDLHGLASAEMYFHGHMGKLKSWLFQQKINFQIRFYDLVYVVSPKLLDYYGKNIKRGVVIYGGVTDNEFFQTNISPPSVFTIGYTGNSNPYQGIDIVLETASLIRQQNLFLFRLNLILSNGENEIKERLDKLNLLDITEINFKISHSEVPNKIARSSVLVVARPSLLMTEYAYPSKLPEYLATGIPVITTDVGPIPFLFKGENCIIIIPSQNIKIELINKLVELQSMSEQERLGIGQRGRDFVEKKLTWNKLGQIINESLQLIK